VATASALGLALLALSVWAAPADAVVAKVGGHAYGLTPIRGVNPAALPSVQRALRASPRSATGPLPYDSLGNLSYHGGPVMHSVTTHVVYWDPNGEFTATTKGIVNKFFTDVGHDSGLPSNVMGVAGQYGDGAGHALYSSTFESEGTDATAYPTSGCSVPGGADPGPPYTHCITDAQLQTELSAYLAVHSSLPKGPAQQYFVLFPHKVVTCFSGTSECSNNVFCAYHGTIAGGTSNEIIYSDIPFSLLDSGHVKDCQVDANAELQQPNPDNAGGKDTETRFADVALKYTSHEYTEAATDPLLNAWWETAHGQENGDKCNFAGSGTGLGEDPNAFLPTLGGSAVAGTLYDQLINGDHFYIQSEWDNAGKACLMKPTALSAASFTASPSSGVVGSAVKFSGAVTDPYGGPGFTWKFGDGTESSGANPEHVYAAEGSYEVTMTPKDAFTGSTTTPVVHMFVVDELPHAAFSFEPNPAEEGKAVKFKPTGSTDPDGSITGYLWKFGDGSPDSTAEAPEHTYAAAGSYTVTLTVTDSTSQKGTTTHSVTVDGLLAVVTGAASGLGPTSATLNATVNPHGANVTECKFEYGPTSLYGSTAACASLPGSGNSPVAVSAAVTGLSGSTLYHFRIVAKNSVGEQEGLDRTFTTTTPNPAVETFTPFTPLPTQTPTPAPNSSFGAISASLNRTTGAITFTESIADPGTFSWLLTFQNGKFGVFAASTSKCKTGYMRLNGRCRPAKIVYARGSKAVGAAGSVIFTVKPTSSALTGLKNALKRKKALPVTITLTFQSALGGAPVSHTRSATFGLRK
jgi:PKD repeat protein